MAQEEKHAQKCRNSDGDGGGGGSGSGSRSSKKLKQKKVPQRGLGVAQLEKIRLEEQQKKDAANNILSNNSIVSPSNSSCLAVQCANLRHSPSPSTIPLPRPSLADLSPPNSLLFRPPLSIPNADSLHPNCVTLSKPLNGTGVEIGWSEISGSGNGKCPKFWNCEYNSEGENQRLEDRGFGLLSSMSLPCESCPPPNVTYRTPHIQQPSFSSKVNVPSRTSSASVMNFHLEPPSNQSYHSNSYPTMWPEEEKKVGIKRPYSFSLENPPGPSLHGRFPPTYVAPPITRSDESASCSNGGTNNIEPINPAFRESPSSSASMYEPNLSIVTKENGNLSGDFLTLALPTSTLPHPSSKFKPPSAYVATHHRQLSELEGLPYPGSMEESVHQQGLCGLIERHPFYRFIPSAKAHTGQTANTTSNCKTGQAAAVSNCNGEAGGGVDLNLKL
ncbi:uncharacterized protein LOC132307653 [Cornus florida]|uniref:uncharacterized protein LOC132307653 n=1 Tax=Cornus florida TaxID=4283 RepID=UPI0028969B72|nr:uncharacterized protein LOC132307653 [Cornus florida]